MVQRRRRKTGDGGRGGYREDAGRKSLFPGKWEDGAPATGGTRTTIVLSRVGLEAAVAKQEELSAREGRSVSFSDTMEWCVRKATRTAMDA
jgi:hypothetical protein